MTTGDVVDNEPLLQFVQDFLDSFYIKSAFFSAAVVIINVASNCYILKNFDGRIGDASSYCTRLISRFG